jgi:ferritin-like protein
MMKQIECKAELVAALKDGAEIEHQLMCSYLYAAFSLKRDPDDTCNNAQFEYVRRWSSTLLAVARQEMEHLSLVNGMLTAIGEQPYFLRQHIPEQGVQSPYFAFMAEYSGATTANEKPVAFPYKFEKYQQETIKRFVCGECPPSLSSYPDLNASWCFEKKDGQQGQMFYSQPAPSEPGAEPGESHLITYRKESCALTAKDEEIHGGESYALTVKDEEIHAGDVQELYTAICEAFNSLKDPLFVPCPPQVVIPVEYNVFVFPVTDRDSAIAAVNIILEQGEGLKSQWTYESHFRRFFEMHEEYVKLESDAKEEGSTFCPAYPLITNPQRQEQWPQLTKRVFDLANDSYVLLLLMLTSLYSRFQEKEGAKTYLFTALAQMAFAPAMTMIIRPLNEVLVHLRVNDKMERTGSNYCIAAPDRDLLEHPERPEFGNIDFFLGRWKKLAEELAATLKLEDQFFKAAVVPSMPVDTVKNRLRYIYQSAYRITANLGWIYKHGPYPKFVVSV